MYALKFSKTYDFGIMEQNGIKHVLEDKFYADEKIFCIADGITRDFVDGSPMEYPETMEDVKIILEKYPNPSGAARAAKDCVNNVVTYLKEKSGFDDTIEGEDLKKAVEYANFAIAKINEGRKINYTSEDEYCCVSVGGIIENERLKCYCVGDSAIRVLDENYHILFDTMSLVQEQETALMKLGEKTFPKLFNYSHDFFRKYKRMHRNQKTLLSPNNFGVLNGDEKAMEFVNTYDISLEKAKYILAFSDGCADLIDSKEKVKNVIQYPEQIKEKKHEKTLIIYEKTGN